MTKSKKINEPFLCKFCEKKVPIHPTGSSRNHCPYCLISLHLDNDIPGDRNSSCHGKMIIQKVEIISNDKFKIKFKCKKCGKIHHNKSAPDDDFNLLLELSII